MKPIELFGYIDAYICDQDIAPMSKKVYKHALRQFFRWLDERAINSVTKAVILQWKNYLEECGLRCGTRSHYIVAVRRFFSWCEDNHIHPNIAKNIMARRKHRLDHCKDPLTAYQVSLLLESIDRSTLEGKRDAALINLLVRTGMRLIEIQRANLCDLDFTKSSPILWIKGKGRDDKDQFVVLTQSALEPLQDYFASRGIVSKSTNSELPMFISVSDRNMHQRLTTFSLGRIIKNHLVRCNIKNRRITAHSLRHTFSILSMKAGASLYDVQLALRHVNPATTQIYLRGMEMEKRLTDSAEQKISSMLPDVLKR